MIIIIFLKGDVCDSILLDNLFSKFPIDYIIHLAAESHVDNSIKNPINFIHTNILGTVNLLEVARKNWANSSKKHLFYNISTDEVYGSLGKHGLFTEKSSYSPTHLIQRRKLVQIILLELMVKPMIFHS